MKYEIKQNDKKENEKERKEQTAKKEERLMKSTTTAMNRKNWFPLGFQNPRARSASGYGF